MRIDRSNSELGTVLVVDDDPAVRDLAKMMLEEEGFRVLTSECSQTALGPLQRSSGVAEMMNVSAAMPGPIDGCGMSEMISQVAWPQMTVVVAAGAPPGEGPEPRFAPRAWRADDVVRAVRLLARQVRGDRARSSR